MIMIETVQVILLWMLLSLNSFGVILVFLSRRREKLQKTLFVPTLLALLVNLILVIIRGQAVGGLPLSNGFEFALCLMLVVYALYLLVTLRLQFGELGLILYPIMIGLCGWMLQQDMQVHPLPPALRSAWLEFHVSAAVLAYGTFLVSFVFAWALVATLKKTNDEKRIEKLDQWSYYLALMGLPFLTIMLITGAVWAEFAWGRYWSWDPKETWALITWLVYALYLHLRVQGWTGRKAAVLNMVGFAAVIFTFFGVSYLLPGLHSYIS